MTADFVKKVNDAFDVLNVRSYGKKAASPISANSIQHLKVLSDMKAESESWYVNVKGKKYRSPCFDGLIQDINVITAIYDGLVKKGPLKFLLTGHLNQDCLENIFSQIRSKGGHRFYLLAREFHFAYRNLCSTLMLASIPSANCEYDEDGMLTSLSRLSSEASSDPADSDGCNPSAKQLTTEPDMNVISSIDFESTAAVTNVLTYIGGYLVHKIHDFDFSCDHCMRALVTTETNVVEEGQMYMHLKV